DDIVLFKPLTLDEVEQIVALLTKDLSRRLEERNINVEITDAARKFIAKAGYDPVYGARPLRRYLQRELETRIGRALIAGDVVDGATIEVDLENGELTVTHHMAN
ncbi:MAG: type VI secretion system ATPase TssH, partial [Desulfobacterales bacterium]